MRKTLLPALGLCAFAAAAAPAATIVHDYEFNGSTVTDSVGTANGTLVGNANVSGGTLNLDGNGDYVQFGTKLIPTSGAFSLYFSYTFATAPSTPGNGGIAEVVSQGVSGSGFYVGQVGSQIRLTDTYSGGIGVTFPTGSSTHDILLTDSGSQVSVYVDGTLAWTHAGDIARGATGDNTRFGNQFGSYAEQFQGSLDAVRIFSGVATYAEASTSNVPEPAGWAMMLTGFAMIGGMARRGRKAALA